MKGVPKVATVLGRLKLVLKERGALAFDGSLHLKSPKRLHHFLNSSLLYMYNNNFNFICTDVYFGRERMVEGEGMLCCILSCRVTSNSYML